MKLEKYLDQAGLSAGKFGRLGGWADETVRQWANGGRIPRYAQMMRIVELTDGEVQPADFYPPPRQPLPVPPPQAAPEPPPTDDPHTEAAA